MSFTKFGDQISGKSFRVLDEIQLRINAGILFTFALFAMYNGIRLRNFEIIPYITGAMALNFTIGLFINPNYAPSMLLAKIFAFKRTPKYIGAIQKQFAWGLGLVLTSVIFTLSTFLTSDPTWFPHVCMLCLICNSLLAFETIFGVCAGCELYFFAIDIKLIKKPKPEDRPNCMGDSCEI